MCSWFGKPFQYANKLERNRGSPHRTEAATDLTRWRLTNVDGRQTWRYHEDSDSEAQPQTLLEKHSLGLNTVCRIHFLKIQNHTIDMSDLDAFSLDSHQNIRLHTSACANVVLLTYLLTILFINLKRLFAAIS